jgi:hypothetical protein
MLGLLLILRDLDAQSQAIHDHLLDFDFGFDLECLVQFRDQRGAQRKALGV